MADGDLVTIDAEKNEINMAVSDEEIAARFKSWKAPKSKVNRGTLAKYARLVGDASHGVSPASESPPPSSSLSASCGFQDPDSDIRKFSYRDPHIVK